MAGIFDLLESESSFIDYVTSAYNRAADGFIANVECGQTIDPGRAKLAFTGYQQNIAKFAVLLHSENPDQYKRAGALLHALITTRMASDLYFSPSKEEIDGGLTRLPYGDGKYAMSQIDFYEAYHNELLAFDTAYRCCAAYEGEPVIPSWDYVQNMCFYLSQNGARSLDTYFMLFKSLMFRPEA